MANEWKKVGSLEVYRKEQEQSDDSGFMILIILFIVGLLALGYYALKFAYMAACALFYYATLPWWYPLERLTEKGDIIMQTGTSFYGWFVIICTLLMVLFVDLLIANFCIYIIEKNLY